MARLRTFHNMDPEVRPQFNKAFKWAVVDRIAGRRRRTSGSAPVDVVDAVSVPERAGAVWLGHSTVLFSLGGVRILTDPIFAQRISVVIKRNVPNVLPVEAMPSIDLVWISHNHRDHLDKPSIQALDAVFAPRYVVGLGVERYLKAWGVDGGRITSLNWWEGCTPLPERADLEVFFVPAQHWSQRGALDRNKTLWGGFVGRAEGQSVYFAGDSGYFDGFAEIGRRFPGIDLAAIPIGAYDPEWFMQPQHMNPEQAGQSFLDVGAERMLSIHWGTYKLTDEPLDEPPSRLEDWRVSTRVASERLLTLAVGGGVLL